MSPALELTIKILSKFALTIVVPFDIHFYTTFRCYWRKKADMLQLIIF